jgi:hypothetical protein
VDEGGLVLASSVESDVSGPFPNMQLIIRFREGGMQKGEEFEAGIVPVEGTPYYVVAIAGTTSVARNVQPNSPGC